MYSKHERGAPVAVSAAAIPVNNSVQECSLKVPRSDLRDQKKSIQEQANNLLKQFLNADKGQENKPYVMLLVFARAAPEKASAVKDAITRNLLELSRTIRDGITKTDLAPKVAKLVALIDKGAVQLDTQDLQTLYIDFHLNLQQKSALKIEQTLGVIKTFKLEDCFRKQIAEKFLPREQERIKLVAKILQELCENGITKNPKYEMVASLYKLELPKLQEILDTISKILDKKAEVGNVKILKHTILSREKLPLLRATDIHQT